MVHIHGKLHPIVDKFDENVVLKIIYRKILLER